MANIENITATTETEAVNVLLQAIGEAPVTSVDTARADVEAAVNTLRNVTRAVLNKRWKFNTEFGLALSPTVTDLSWTDPDGEVKTLYVFKPPTSLARWELSMISEQADFDVTVRISKEYAEAGASVLLFYDRKNNRDGFEAAELKDGKLWIDATWYLNFEWMPDTARRYVTLRATRQFVMDQIKDSERAAAIALEEMEALRELRFEQGQDDRYSLLDSPDVAGILGDRLYHRADALDFRSDP